MGAGLVAAMMLASVAPNAHQALDRYAVGQVWAYHTRPGDAGSLLKIQAIERDPAALRGGPIYHISVIGVHFADPAIAPILPHLPVGRATLDASVTQQAAPDVPFPEAAPGIAEWQRARGGVYTMTLAEIIADVDAQSTREPPPQPQAGPNGSS